MNLSTRLSVFIILTSKSRESTYVKIVLKSEGRLSNENDLTYLFVRRQFSLNDCSSRPLYWSLLQVLNEKNHLSSKNKNNTGSFEIIGWLPCRWLKKDSHAENSDSLIYSLLQHISDFVFRQLLQEKKNPLDSCNTGSEEVSPPS